MVVVAGGVEAHSGHHLRRGAVRLGLEQGEWRGEGSAEGEGRETWQPSCSHPRHTHMTHPPLVPPPSQFGQLGLGDVEDRSRPTPIPVTGPSPSTAPADDASASQPPPSLAIAAAVVAQVACGWRHTVAVTAEGRVYSWGRGVDGQLGLGEECDQ